MAETKRGGLRAGAGRPALQRGKKRVNWTISNDTRNMVQTYTSRLGISESDFVDSFMAHYVPQCNDIFRCPNCGSPIAWSYGRPLTDAECSCGYRYPQELKDEINKIITNIRKKTVKD